MGKCKPFLCINSIGINELMKFYSKKENSFPNTISPSYIFELLKEYSSFAGCYSVKKFSGNNISLKKIKNPLNLHDFLIPENKETFNLVYYPGKELIDMVREGEFVVSGEFNFDKVNGLIRKKGRFGNMCDIEYRVVN